MSTFDWFSLFVEEYKENIIDGWLLRVEENYPGLYNHEELLNNGRPYFQLLLDIHIPLEQHSKLGIISQMCSYHTARNTPFEHLLHSSHLWRDSITYYLIPYIFDKHFTREEVTTIIRLISNRIDSVQRLIGETFSEHNHALIDQRDKKIKSLHNDRLSTLGKMGASMAHEIRNPLTVIEGFLKLVRMNLSEQSLSAVSNYLSIIDNEFESLSRQISGFLSFSKNNGVEEPFTSYDSETYIETVVELISPRCMNENIELILSIDSKYILTVQKIALQQVLLNLLNNAIEALQSLESPKCIHIITSEDNENYYISVKDNGEGISDEIRDSIFDPFTTGKQNGTGLGLSICKSIMEKNGGSISFSSRKGETIFTLSMNKEWGLKVSSL